MEVKKYKLGEIATIIPGYAFKSADFGYGENIVIKIKDIIPPSINILEADKVGYTPDDKFRLEVGDYVMAMTGATIGKIGRMNIRKTNVFINQRVCKFIPNEHLCNKDYLYYLLNNECFTRFVTNNIDSKLAQPNIGHPTLYKFEHLFPPIIKQKQIASVLSNIDSKIELNRAINQNLEAMAKQLYDYWFVQFDFPDENGKPYKSSGGKMVWNEKLKRKIPENWEVMELKDVVNVNRGISYNSETILGDGVPMINLASFNVDGTYKHSGIKTYNGNYSEDKILKPFDLIMCNTQQTSIDFSKDIIGKAFLVPFIFEGDVVSSHHVTTLIPKQKEMKAYLAYLSNTKHFHKYATGCCSGTNIMGLNYIGLSLYKMEIPPVKLLQQFESMIIQIEKRKGLIILENEMLTKQRDELLPLLMNGQVSVNSDLSDD